MNLPIRVGGHSMHKFSWRTLIIFVMVLLVGVILLGLGTAYLSKLKQQRRQASENDLFNYRASIEVFCCADQTLSPVLDQRRVPISVKVGILSAGPKRERSAARDE